MWTFDSHFDLVDLDLSYTVASVKFSAIAIIIFFNHILFFSESVFILCHSLILLSVDLSSPHVKNKMTKREFVKNLRGLVQGLETDYLGDLYDNVYLEGHIALKAKKSTQKTTFPFERPYGKIFLQM